MKKSEIRVYRPESHMWPAPANSFLLEDADGCILVDAGCRREECYRLLRSFIEKAGFRPADVHTVVLSHAHPDHMGAMPLLLEEANPRILIHELEEPLAADPGLLNLSFDMDHARKYYVDRLGETDPDSIDIIEYFEQTCPMGSAKATETFSSGDVLELAGRRLEVLHTPGHAPGHTSFYDSSEGILLSGDVVGAVVAWYCPSGGGAAGYLESLDLLDSLDIKVILPSHGGEMANAAEAVRSTRQFIMARETLILKALEDGARTLLELTDILFGNPALRLFPGLQITDSHLQKLERESRVVRIDSVDNPLFKPGDLI